MVSGTSVTFANLKPSVVEKDIQDLSAAIGEVKEVHLVVGRSEEILRLLCSRAEVMHSLALQSQMVRKPLL